MTGFADGENRGSIRDKINSVLVTEFETMAELLADTAMTYTAGQANTVAAGRSIVTRKEGFRFEVRPVGATDNTSTTAGGVLIKALPDASGAYNWVQLGGNGNGVADNLPVVANIAKIFPKVTSTLFTCGKINFPDGTYYFSDMFAPQRPIHIFGTTGGTADFKQFVRAGTTFLFAAGVHGVRITSGTVEGGLPEGNSSNMILENIVIKFVGKSGFTHGIWASGRFTAMNVAVWGASGDGWHINATCGLNGNANSFSIFKGISKENNRNGIYVEGDCANAGQVVDFDSTQNGGWGIYDSSFLGNNYFGIHTDMNVLGPFRTDNPNAPHAIVGLYTESNQGPCVFAPPTSNMGGAIASGIVAPNNGLAPSQRVSVYQPVGNRSAVYHINVTNAGSGYTSAPTVTISAPTGQVQATATAVVHGGQIKQINMVNRGQGYSNVPAVTITDASGTGATATAILAIPETPLSGPGEVQVILLNEEGSGYVNPTVTIAAPNTLTATAQAVVNTATGQLERIIVTNPGFGYHDTPTVTITGGGGTGATATAVVGGASRNGIKQEIEIGGSLDGSDILRFTRVGLPNEPVSRLRYIPGGASSAGMSNDLVWNENNLGAAELFRIRGSKTTFTGGRRTSQGLVMDFARGLILNGARNVSMSGTIPPTSGEYARGDIIFAVDPSPGASPGVVCTTTGLAGSTAVFRNMAVLS